ncbi:MAG: PKD domain-containing protein, partial [Methanoregula sp.]|nr:PKD domain-containing protein [Methanoregula sp.]
MQIYVDGTLRTFTGFGTDDTWSLGEILEYTIPASEPMPNKVDIVYAENPRRGTNAALIATLLLGEQTYLPQDLATYTITASASPGGSISPPGAITVISGDPASFTITPDPFYTIFDVLVDGISVGNASSYTFPPVTASHTITVTFAPPSVPSYSINATYGPNGMISPGNVTVLSGTNQSFAITPNSNYRIANVIVNGTYHMGPVANFTFTNVTSNQTINALFVPSCTAGLTGNYYTGQTWTTLAASNSVSQIRFADSASGYASDVINWPNPIIGRVEDFSVNFTGSLKIRAEDDYTFYLTSDDGSWLTINGTQIIDNGGVHSPRTYQNTVHLKAGSYPIIVRMFENTGEAVLYLEYSNTTIARTLATDFCRDSPPVAAFNATPLNGNGPLPVQFTDLSTDATVWSWDFGDGTPVSNDRNPLHTYTTAGQYNVTLTATNSFGTSTVTKVKYITVGYFARGFSGTYYPNAYWTEPGYASVDPRIRFADISGNTTTQFDPTDRIGWPNPPLSTDNYFSVIWDGYLNVPADDTYSFLLKSDDGSCLLIDEGTVVENGCTPRRPHSPEIEYGTISLTAGYHHIVVKMFEETGQAVARLDYKTPSMAAYAPVTDIWYVNATPQPPVAAFTGTPLSGTVPLAVRFTDTSANSPVSWSWTFGDGDTTNNTQQNPLHIYNAPGTYSVSLTATNAAGSNTVTRSNYIIASPVLPVANFTATPRSGTVPLTVVFNDTTANFPTSWLWNFGDGDITNNTQQHPVHRYSSAGSYTVTLTSTNTAGSNSSAKPNYITVNSLTPVSNFTATPLSGIRPLTVVFTDLSANTPTSWLWTFGDGNTTNNSVQNPVHAYASSGTYTVIMTATNAAGSNTSTRTGYITVTQPPPVAGFSGTPVSGNRPFTVRFTDSSTNSPTSWLWNFGDGNTTSNTQQNPAHLYRTAGTYTVVLTATNSGGSNISTRTNYITANLPPRQTIFSDDFESVFSPTWIQTGS